jgi:hypothetical protein
VQALLAIVFLALIMDEAAVEDRVGPVGRLREVKGHTLFENSVIQKLKGRKRHLLVDTEGFVVLPRRGVVERTIAWIDQQRRMSKDYERLCASGEALVYAVTIRLMTRRLVRT